MWSEAEPPTLLQGLQCCAQLSLRTQMGSLSYLKTLAAPSKALLALLQDNKTRSLERDFVYSLAPELHGTDCPGQ